LLLEGPILSTLLRLSAPNVLNLLALAGMITFDALFLGRLGADALAGVSLAFPFVMLIQHSANGGMGGGVSSAIARALGARQRERADALVYHTFVLALALGARYLRRPCCSQRRSCFAGWADRAKCSRPRSPIPTSRLEAPYRSAC
jgi:Na+-driven multidrug efflux pump